MMKVVLLVFKKKEKKKKEEEVSVTGFIAGGSILNVPFLLFVH